MRIAAVLSILLLLAPAAPPFAAPQPDTRLEGLVLGFDGTPALGYHVHLIDEDGQQAMRAEVGEDGNYRMRDLDAGRYALALETPDGRYAAVNAAPLKVRSGHLVRRDLKLVERDPAAPADMTGISPSFGSWWAGLSNGARIWTVVALVVVVGISAEALSSDESSASEFAN